LEAWTYDREEAKTKLFAQTKKRWVKGANGERVKREAKP